MWLEMKEDCFKLLFSCDRKCFVLHVPEANFSVASTSTVPELAQRLIQHHNIPPNVYKELCLKLVEYVEKRAIYKQDEELEKRLDEFGNIDEAAKFWTDSFVKGHLNCSKVEPISNDAIFSDVYHSLIHSHFINTLLELEHNYALAMSKLLKQRNENLARVEEQCRREMEDALSNIGIKYTDHHVNQLAKKHIETSEMEASKWTSEISNLKEKQKRNYRDQVMKLYERMQIEHTSDTKSLRQRDLSYEKSPTTSKSPSHTRREESFTVHLGAQMKMSHNLRLISCDVLDLCRLHVSEMLSGLRLQTAISLYSNSLCGLVLLVDNRLNSFSGIKKEFAKVCDQSTDFHFLTLEQQIEKISGCLIEGGVSKTSKLSNFPPSVNKMRTGDFYVTRHSNLSEVHVVYHLVVDDSIHGDISSRHPVIVACRNIIKTSFQSDVCTLTLPLLLVHEMSEEMTIPWCLRRAELMFKCIKGFMMELPHCSFNIQFLVPQSLSDETFSSLSTMMPSIFRMSNPVIAKS